MRGEVVFVSGSPAASSRSTAIARALAGRLDSRGQLTRSYSIRDFDPADVLLARAEAPAVKRFVEVIRGAAGLVLSTPVYKATYAGALKALVDLVPADALAGKPALGIATTKLAAHGSEVERAYAALFAFFGARTVPSLVVLDDELVLDAGAVKPGAAAEERLAKAAHALSLAIDERVHAATIR
jgi:FMN reductase